MMTKRSKIHEVVGLVCNVLHQAKVKVTNVLRRGADVNSVHHDTKFVNDTLFSRQPMKITPSTADVVTGKHCGRLVITFLNALCEVS